MGTTSTFFGSSGGGGGICPSYWFTTGCSGWTPPRDGCAVIHIIGAGAGVSCTSCCGGGAGGYIRYAAEFTTADSPYCVVVGASANTSGGCSFMCGGSPAWCMVAFGGQEKVGGVVCFYSNCPNDTNMTFACGGCGGGGNGGGGAVGLFASPGGSGYPGGDGTESSMGGGGAGVGGAGGKACCCNCNERRTVGGGGGSAGPSTSSINQNDAYGTEYMMWSSPGPALVTTPVDHIKYFKFISQWGAGGSVTGMTPSQQCLGRWSFSTEPGIGGGGAGSGTQGSFNFAAQRGGAFAGGGAGAGGQYGGYPGGGGGGGVTCSARCMNICGGNGAVIVEYIEV